MKPSNLKSAIVDILQSTSLRAVPLIQGAPGVGKSDLGRQIASELGWAYTDVRLSLYDSVDLRGFPMPDHENQRMRTLRADFMPAPDDDTPRLIMLDEITAIQDRAVQVAAYQLILDRQIGEHRLPDATKLIAAGNFTSGADGAFGTRMSSALRRRFWWLRFDVDVNEWSQWAIDHDMPYQLIAFHRLRDSIDRGLLHRYDPDLDEDNFPSPASWENVGHYVNAHIQDPDPAKIKVKLNSAHYSHLEMLGGMVGTGAAAEFLGFLPVATEIESPDRIIADPDGAKVSSDTAVLYAQVGALAKRANQTTMGNIMRYAERIPGDFRTLFVRDAIRADPTTQHTPAFTQWSIANQGALV